VRKIVVQMSLSLDGYFEGPDRDISWHMVDEEVHRDVNDFLRPMSAFLQGRVTHELMADYWPTADQDPQAPEPIRHFSGIWREMPKLVYSRTLDTTEWNTTVIREVDPDEVRALKNQPGGDMCLGGADLAATFMKHDLIDEYRFYLNPLVLGAGSRLFPDGISIPLQLTETRAFDNGVVLTRYRRR
jgi:dihydrofolate reductase